MKTFPAPTRGAGKAWIRVPDQYGIGRQRASSHRSTCGLTIAGTSVSHRPSTEAPSRAEEHPVNTPPICRDP